MTTDNVPYLSPHSIHLEGGRELERDIVGSGSDAATEDGLEGVDMGFDSP